VQLLLRFDPAPATIGGVEAAVVARAVLAAALDDVCDVVRNAVRSHAGIDASGLAAMTSARTTEHSHRNARVRASPALARTRSFAASRAASMLADMNPHSTFLPVLACVAASGMLRAQWTPMTPATPPPARAAACMASNPATGTAVLFGGIGGPSGFTQFNDTWSYDGTNWTQLAPPTSPSAKFATDLVCDVARQVWVMYGGNATYSAPGTNETWEFDGATWTQRSPTTNPGPIGLHAMAYDSSRQLVVLYGGRNGSDNSRTWEYDGTNWTQRFPATNPGPLECHSMCFHAGVGKTILFGGVNANGALPPDSTKTWAWDGTNWTELVVPGIRPPLRERASMAYDPIRQVCVLVGGMHYSNGQTRNDTWELQLIAGTWTWTQVATTTVGRFQSTLAFLPTPRHLVRFGGQTGASTFYGDTNEYGARSAPVGVGCAGTNGIPSLTAVDAPRLGQTFTLQVANLEPTFNLAVLVFGFTPLPGVDLGPLLGMTGCNAYQSGDILFTAPTGAGGATSWSWTPVSGTLGGVFYCQALCLDPTANAFGFTISNGLAATIGY
jgi:hypothetical protein